MPGSPFQVPVSSLPPLSGAQGGVGNTQTQNIAKSQAPTPTYENGAVMPGFGTMTANISSPNNTTTTPAPAVITSSAASTDLANKQNQIAQLNADTANHQTAVNTPPPTPTTTTSDTSSTSSSGTPSSLDTQVNDILSGFNTQEGNINSTANTEATDLGNEATDAQTALDTAATASLSKLDAISSGAYPLSPAEQQVMSATQQGFTQAIQFQQQANASYTGQITEAMASLGISTSAPTEAIGMIYAAISSGSTKIADLNAQMATSLGNLSLAFQKEDFSEVQNAWDETSKYMEDRITTLTTMQKNVQDAATAQVKELQDYTTTAIDAYTKSANFDFTVADAAIKNGLAQGTLDERTANDLSERALSAQSNSIAQERADTEATTAGDKTQISTDLTDSEAYIKAGGNPETARQKFIAAHPADASEWTAFYSDPNGTADSPIVYPTATVPSGTTSASSGGVGQDVNDFFGSVMDYLNNPSGS